MPQPRHPARLPLPTPNLAAQETGLIRTPLPTPVTKKRTVKRKTGSPGKFRRHRVPGGFSIVIRPN